MSASCLLVRGWHQDLESCSWALLDVFIFRTSPGIRLVVLFPLPTQAAGWSVPCGLSSGTWPPWGAGGPVSMVTQPLSEERDTPTWRTCAERLVLLLRCLPRHGAVLLGLPQNHTESRHQCKKLSCVPSTPGSAWIPEHLPDAPVPCGPGARERCCGDCFFLPAEKTRSRFPCVYQKKSSCSSSYVVDFMN